MAESAGGLFEQIQRLVDGHVDAAVLVDGERRVLHYNLAYEALTGRSGRELAARVAAGARCHQLFALDVCEQACVGCGAHQAGRRRRVDEVAAVRGDGEALTMIVNATPIDLPDGRRVVLESYRDVTSDVRIQRRLKLAIEQERTISESLEETVRARTAELRAAQAQLVHQEKMSSLGRMVAGIAHELNNPINFIYGNIDFLGQYLEDLLRLVKVFDGAPLADDVRAEVQQVKAEIELDFMVDDWRKLLRSIRAGAARTADIVADLKNFSRTDSQALGEADVIAGIETSLNLIGPLLKNRIEVRRRIAPGLPRVVCNAGHVNQVFMNVLTNAAQAITGAGWIEIVAEAVDDGATLRVSITDSGPGIEPELMAKITDPFFTTKEVGAGTGLGLWIVANIVRAHRGSLTWRNRPGAGAEFVVDLPVKGPAPTVEPRPAEP
ncbi:MAG TPA: ATP-binding protein [Kofleriaceae bacterium]|nr:ATP-binding protein [Kofleriaceae bacterium]